MKKSVLFSAVCIALLSLSSVSCEKKEKVFSPVGTWDLIRATQDVYTNGELTKHLSISASEMGEEMTFTFEATGKFVRFINGEGISGSYIFSGDFSALTVELDKTEVIKVAKASDDTLILCLFDEEYTDENGKQIHEIIKYEFARRK